MESQEIELRVRSILLQLNESGENPIYERYVRPYKGDGEIKLVIIGQDPTVRNPESRESIAFTLNLDKKGSALYKYVKHICRILDITIDNVYATNLFKYFYSNTPADMHNGPWDLQFSVYGTAVNGEIADVVIFSPDMDEFGNFVKSGSRNKFYSQGNRINVQLPDMLIEASAIVKNTIEQLSLLYQQNTTETVNEAYTEECLKAIYQYYKTSLDEAKKSGKS